MIKGVIDIGSNSVRLLVSDNDATILKTAKITRLAEGMGGESILQEEAVERTILAVSFFVDKAKELLAENIYIFATAAVRRSKNKEYFCEKVFDVCGIYPEVISGETEALLGAYGALDEEDGCLVDVGGASSEIVVYRDKKPIYSYSLNVGCVWLYNLFGEDCINAEQFLNEKIKEYGKIPLTPDLPIYAVGGTATSCSAYVNGIIPYDPIKNHGSFLTSEQLEKMKTEFIKLGPKERELVKGVQSGRGRVIVSGILILLSILKYLNADKFVISEKDNLEGFLKYKEGKNE